MDKKDSKLLAALLMNSRASMTQLAKKAGVSREVALYRITNLNKNIIRGYYATLNLNALGFKRYGCLMQFSRVSVEKEEALIEDIAKHPFVTFVGPQIGKWNVAFDIHARDEIHLQSILKELKLLAGTHLDTFVITNPGTNYNYFPLKYLGLKKEGIIKKITIKKTTTIDETDKKILHQLAQHARTEYTQLTKTTKLSANAVKYRIKNLEQSGIIQGYTISVDYNALGFQFYNLQLKINVLDDKTLLSYITNHPNILYYYKYIGQENWDMDLGIIVKSIEELRKTIIDIKKDFGDILTIHNIVMNPALVKDDITPEGVFN
ncbi:MAG: Lrp/AsnC family transcriptional regulator [Candidatus Woesearchaeota archaeon]